MEPGRAFALCLKANQVYYPICSAMDKIRKSWPKDLFYDNALGEMMYNVVLGYACT